MFRAGILPFKTLSKNRDGGEFRCALHTGMTFNEAASCFATVAALVVDEELRWSEGVNGLCLVISPEGHCVKVWSGSANNHGLAPISAVIEQLNVTLVENLRDPVTFHMPKNKRSTSPSNAGPRSPTPEAAVATAGAGRPEVKVNKVPKGQHEVGEKKPASKPVAAGPEETPRPSSQHDGGSEPKDEETPIPPKSKKKKEKKGKKKEDQQDEATPSASAAKVEISPEQARANALAAAERAFNKSEGNRGSGWSQERSVAWLWLLAFPLVYIVIGWLFCIVMNKTSPGAYPQRFLF